MFITQLGSASDYATLYATGSSKLSFAASNGASLYIDEIRSTNSAGVDMLGLLNGAKALSASGVTVVAGSGSDVLVGGKGVDHIITGGGNNDIYGSLGQDFVDITGGGLDEFIFNNYQQSKFGSGDHITGFNIFDSIDISDIVSSVSFGGNAASYQTGLATLSSSHSVGFFSTSNHTLYVDTNADGALDSLHDMAFHLDGLNSFNSTSLIG